MPTLSLTKIARALLEDNVSYKLIRHINSVQQFELRRLDFDEAAAVVGTSSRTVGRIVKKLAEKGVLEIEGDKLRISENMQVTR